MIRIISGNFKGKKIFEPNDIKTRPLKDMTKESIFNIINHSNKFTVDLSNSTILDLFSGVGSFGIECLSRGVKKVIFVESYSGVLPILKRNLLNLTSIKNYEIFNKDIYKDKLRFKSNSKFDVIFLDPPYKYKNIENLLIKLQEEELLNKNGVIILHRHKNEKDKFPLNYRVIEKKIYGISKVYFTTYL